MDVVCGMFARRSSCATSAYFAYSLIYLFCFICIRLFLVVLDSKIACTLFGVVLENNIIFKKIEKSRNRVVAVKHSRDLIFPCFLFSRFCVPKVLEYCADVSILVVLVDAISLLDQKFGESGLDAGTNPQIFDFLFLLTLHSLCR